MKWPVQILLGSLLLLSTPVAAAPALGGETGALTVPSADALRPGQLHLAWSTAEDGHRSAVAFGALKRLELSTLHFDSAEKDTVELGLKYELQPETLLRPGIAAGVEDIARERRRSFYGVVSKTLPYGLRMHAGVGNGRYAGGFASLEVRAFPKRPAGVFPDLTLFAEHVDGHGAYGLRLALSRGLKVEAGVDGSAHFAGLSYNYY